MPTRMKISTLRQIPLNPTAQTRASCRDGAEHAGDVVADHEDDQRDKKPVASSEKVAEPSADGGER
jgi:hypothetical protein